MPILFEPWLQYQHPIVRQLAFAIASPNIIGQIPQQLDILHQFELHPADFWQQQYLRYEPRLLQLDQQPDILLAFVEKLKSTRLGLRFEYLIWFWLQDDEFHDLKLLAHSVQIIDGKNTLGELDFLLWNPTNQQVEHWEVALKFYLAEGDFNLPEWYGLNRSDTLHRKLNHFSQKQFQFESVGPHMIQKRLAVLKGQLYLPLHFESALAASVIPQWINPARRIGHWGSQILNEYYRVSRQEWICPNKQQSSPNAIWWTNGLYRNIKTEHDFMFRQVQISSKSVGIM